MGELFRKYCNRESSKIIEPEHLVSTHVKGPVQLSIVCGYDHVH